MKRCDILIPGNYFCDVIFTDLPRFPSLGSEIYTGGLTVTVGGVLNTVIALRRLGVDVGWVGYSGADMFSQFVLDTAAREGIDTSLIQRLDTPFQRVTVSLSYPEDRAFISYVDPAQNSVQMVFEALDSVDFRHLHFTGFQLDPRTLELLDIVRGRGVRVTMDCQDRPFTLETPMVREVLGAVDIFMPNAKEAMQLTGHDTVAEAAAVLGTLVPVLVIKDGANGATAWTGDQEISSPAIDVVPVDTTGAGDVFNAGFLSGLLEGESLEACLRRGNICGGLSTLGVGGASSAPHRAEVDARLRMA